MKTRTSTKKDLPSILEINKEFDYDNPESFILSSILDDKVIVALEDDKIIGFLLYQELWGNTPFLALVKIKKEYQRNGAGLELINAFETKIQEEGYDSYIGSTVSENIKSQGFLLKAGMNRIGKLNIEDWVEVFFSKDLKGE